jgi:hypothetical protein
MYNGRMYNLPSTNGRAHPPGCNGLQRPLPLMAKVNGALLFL